MSLNNSAIPKYYCFSNNSIGFLNQCVDTAFRQLGMEPLKRINDFIIEFTDNVVSIDDNNHDKIIRVSDQVITTLYEIVDLYVKHNGILNITEAVNLIHIIRNPIEYNETIESVIEPEMHRVD